MAEVVNELPHGKRGALYPWDQYLDGRAWKLTKDNDFTVSLDSMQTMAIAAGKRRGVKVSTRIIDNDIYIQAATN